MANPDFKRTIALTVEVGDLLTHAESIGYDWNQASEILVDIVSNPDCDWHELKLNMSKDCYSKDVEKIVNSFLNELKSPHQVIVLCRG